MRGLWVAFAVGSSGCATAQVVGPNALEFSALHAAQCEDHAAQAKLLRCSDIEEEPTEYSCRYKLPEASGGWKTYQAIVARDGNQWVWLDGETRCAISAVSTLS
jgi:hypothetical protein